MPRPKSPRTIIRGGTIHTATHSFRGDVAIVDERIEAVGASLAVDAQTRVIEAGGMDVLPGFIAVHVHLALPFCGTVSCDDFESGSHAAACGGVTTLIDFAIPGAGQSLAQAHETWRAKAEGISGVDYTWHMALTDRRHIAEIPTMVDMGLPTFKEFMIYESEGWNSDDAMMFATLEEVREHGGMLLVHAESSRVLDLLIGRRHTPSQMRKLGAKLHPITRPNFVEAEAIERAIHWATVTGGTLYIVHMSTAEGADLVRRAREKGSPVWAETCAQYLTLDDSVFDGPDGHLFACCPQVKKQGDIERLWSALERGGDEVCVVSTDTCSFTREQKGLWWVEPDTARGKKKNDESGGFIREGYGDWTKIPMGLPGLETMVPLVYTQGVRAGRISMNRLVALCSTNPACLMGMGTRKGHIAPGYDADITIIDPSSTREVDWREMRSRCDWSPYQGMKLGGFARTTLLRGTVIVDGYKYVGNPGQGQFIERHGPGSLAPA